MNEYEIQNNLAYFLQYTKKHNFITPNTTMMFPWECDLVGVTDSGFMHEYEIKRSKADFNNDKNKIRKHQLLENQHHNAKIPNYFWYVTWNFKLEISDIPEYAGWMVMNDLGALAVMKKAPRLSKRKMDDYQKNKLYNALFYRYWNERRRRK